MAANDDSTESGSTRSHLRSAIITRLQTLSTESRHVGQAFSSQQGLSHTDLEALLHVLHEEEAGTPTTPGRIADVLGLTSGAATGIIDRLEREGHVARRRDEHDRRIIRVHYGEHGMAVALDFFLPLAEVTDTVMAGFSDSELAVITRFLTTMGDAMKQHARSVASPAAASPTAAGPAVASPGEPPAGRTVET